MFMVRQFFSIEGYWKVVVYYDVDYNFFDVIEEELWECGASERLIYEIYYTLSSGKAKAVTFSNTRQKCSIVLFNPHRTKRDYINSIVHEAEHVKQAVLEVYNVEDDGEAPAYTIGYIVGRMYGKFYKLMCDCRKS